MLEDVKTAVVSIPSFIEYGDGIGTFSTAIADFINNATAPGREARKIIIDLQQNSGGTVALAFDVYRYFFPRSPPFAGSRMRSHYAGDVLGNALTSQFQSLVPNASSPAYQNAMAEEWVVTDRLNAETGNHFASWAEFYGPMHYNDDDFSLIQQYDLANDDFDNNVLGVNFPDCYFTQNCTSSNVDWKPEDITILTDGLCTSTCALFVEMMQQAGVKTVVIGGRPEPGAMQTASGSRGAASYNSDELTIDFSIAELHNAEAATLSEQYNDTGMVVNYAGFTLRDQMRPHAEIPNQFRYLPADCRIYWTRDNFYNYTRLWLDVHKASYTDQSICIGDSVGKTSQKRSMSARDELASLAEFILQGITFKDDTAPVPHEDEEKTHNPEEALTDEHDGVHDGGQVVRGVICTGNPRICDSVGGVCAPVQFPCKIYDNEETCDKSGCPSTNSFSKQSICKPQCRSVQGPNGLTATCGKNSFCGIKTVSNTQSKSIHGGNKPKKAQPAYDVGLGFCEPWSLGSGDSSCDDIDFFAKNDPKTLATLIGTTLTLPDS